MSYFEDGELQQETQLDDVTSENENPEEFEEELGEEVEEADGEDEQGEETKLLAGKFKTFGGLAQNYIKQRRKLGLPEDLQNYNSSEALEKAYLRDQARIESRSKQASQEGQGQGDNTDFDQFDDSQLLAALTQQQTQIQTALNGGQQNQLPNQIQNQAMNQPPNLPPLQFGPQDQPPQNYRYDPNAGRQASVRHSVLDDYRGTPEEFAERLISDPVKVLREIIREEFNIQGSDLGQALYGALSTISQGVNQVRSTVEQDKELRKLEKALNKSGESLDDYMPEIQTVMKQYPGLQNLPDGFAQALGMARVTKAINTRRQAPTTNKAGLRINSGQGSGVPKQQYGQNPKQTPEEQTKQRIFGNPSKRGYFDD